MWGDHALTAQLPLLLCRGPLAQIFLQFQEEEFSKVPKSIGAVKNGISVLSGEFWGDTEKIRTMAFETRRIPVWA